MGFRRAPLPAEEVGRLRRLQRALASGTARDAALLTELRGLLTDPELHALETRLARLLELPAYPLPGEGWPAIPWPPL